MRESEFQARLRKDLEEILPGCIVLKNDANYIQGIPDLTVLYNGRWATLECKESANAKHQPNQDYYVEKMNGMSYASFVYPENVEEVLREVQHALAPRRKARLPKRFEV